MGSRATCHSGRLKNFGVGELDAQSLGPIFLAEKIGAIAPGGEEDNDTSILPAERRARHCWRSGHTPGYLSQTISPDFSARHVDLN